MIMILKNKTQGNFVLVNQCIMHDKSLKMFDRGLLITLMSLPDNWNFTINGLASIVSDGRDAIRGGLERLQEKGYLVKEQLRENGKFSDICIRINVEPGQLMTEKTVSEEPELEKPMMERSTVENPVPEKTMTKRPLSDNSVSEKPMTERTISKKTISEKPVLEKVISEEPMTEEPVSEKPMTEEPIPEKPMAERPVSDMPTQLNNKESNNKRSNNHKWINQGCLTGNRKGAGHETDNGTGDRADKKKQHHDDGSGSACWSKDEIDLYGL